MRIVAKFQFNTPSERNEIVQQIGTVLDKWSSRKFDMTAANGVIIRRSGASAAFDRSEELVNGWKRDNFTILETVDGGSLQTDVDIIAVTGRTAFRCVLSIGSDGGIAPAEISLRAPRFI